MKSQPHPSCDDCVHWQEQTDSADQVRWGFCHRYPPSPCFDSVDEEMHFVRIWTVLPDWCGEHIHKVQ